MKFKSLSAVSAVAALVMAVLFAPVANAEPDEQMDIFVDGVKVASDATVNMGQEITLKLVITQDMLDLVKQADATVTKVPNVYFSAFNRDNNLDVFSAKSFDSNAYEVNETVQLILKPTCGMSGKNLLVMPYSDLKDGDEIRETFSLNTTARFSVADPEGLCDGQSPSITVVDSQGNTRSDLEHVKYGDTVKYRVPTIGDDVADAVIKLENFVWDEALQEEVPHLRDFVNKELTKGDALTHDFSIGCTDSDGVELMPLSFKASLLLTHIQTAGPFVVETFPDLQSLSFTIDDDYANCHLGGGNSSLDPGLDEPVVEFFDQAKNDLVSVEMGQEFVIEFSNAPEGSVGSATLYSTPKDLGSVVLKNGFGRLKATVPCSVEPGEHTIKAVIKDKLGKVLVRGERKVKVLKSNRCNKSTFVGLKSKPATSKTKTVSKSGAALAKTGSDAAVLAWWASMMFAAAAGVYIARRQRA